MDKRIIPKKLALCNGRLLSFIMDNKVKYVRMDRVTKDKRSLIMSRIKGKNTRPETIMFDALEAIGLTFEKHYKLLGNPDIAFVKEKIAIFIDGDFWHGRDFEKRKDKLPEYWVKKIGRNMRRDRRYRIKLREEGWTVIRLWEHRVLRRPSGCVNRILKLLEER